MGDAAQRPQFSRDCERAYIRLSLHWAASSTIKRARFVPQDSRSRIHEIGGCRRFALSRNSSKVDPHEWDCDTRDRPCEGVVTTSARGSQAIATAQLGVED